MSDIKISKLEFPDNVRKRAGMYIGATYNPQVIAREIVDNSIDEIINGHASTVLVDVYDTNFCVIDNGRGVPVYLSQASSTPVAEYLEGDSEFSELLEDKFEDEMWYHVLKIMEVKDEDTGESHEALSVYVSKLGRFMTKEDLEGAEMVRVFKTITVTKDIFGSLHAGSKFDNTSEVSIGLNGVGSSACNALSTRFIAVSNLSKKDLSNAAVWIQEAAKSLEKPCYVLEYRRGLFHEEHVVELHEVPDYLCSDPREVPSDFGTIVTAEPDPVIWDTVKFKYDVTNLSIARMNLGEETVLKLNGEEIQPFSLREEMKTTNFFQDTLVDFEFSLNNDHTKNRVQVVAGFSNEDFTMSQRGSVNTLVTNEGVHVNAVVEGLGMAMSEIFGGFDWWDVKYGLRVFSLIFTTSPMFSSQTKERLTKVEGTEKRYLVEACKEAAYKAIKSNYEFFDAQCRKILEYKREIGKLSEKSFVDSVIIKGNDVKRSRGLGAHVYDCGCSDRSLAELFIVEGKSAGNTLLQCRDNETQAVLPLRGKPLNASRFDLEDVLENEEMKSLINVIGAGIHPYADVSQARYGKIVITADADPDGRAIAALLLGTLATYLPEAIEAGLVYISDVPLYIQDGRYFFDHEKDQVDFSREVTRFKGLGEMNPDQLHVTAVDPATRRLIRVTPENIEDAIATVRGTLRKKQIMVEAGIVEG